MSVETMRRIKTVLIFCTSSLILAYGVLANHEFATAALFESTSTLPKKQTVTVPGASALGYESASLYAKRGGYVKDIVKIDGQRADIGTRVKQGTLIATLSIPEMANEFQEKQAHVARSEAEVKQAIASVKQADAMVLQKKAGVVQAESHQAEKKANLKLQETRLNRITTLVKKGAVGAESLDEAKYSLEAAKAVLKSVEAEIQTAKANLAAALANVEKAKADQAAADSRVLVAKASLEKTKTLAKYAEIRAPFDGVITARFVDHGDFVQSASSNSGAKPLFEVTRVDKIRVIANVPNKAAPSIKVGQKVVFHSIGGHMGSRFEGIISRSSGVLDPESRTMRVEVDFDNPIVDQSSANKGKKVTLQPGVFGTISIISNE